MTNPLLCIKYITREKKRMWVRFDLSSLTVFFKVFTKCLRNFRRFIKFHNAIFLQKRRSNMNNRNSVELGVEERGKKILFLFFTNKIFNIFKKLKFLSGEKSRSLTEYEVRLMMDHFCVYPSAEE